MRVLSRRAGRPLSGLTGLKKALAANPGMFVTATTSRLMTYALGRPVAANDMPMVRQIVARSAPAYKFEDIVLWHRPLHAVPDEGGGQAMRWFLARLAARHRADDAAAPQGRQLGMNSS